LKIEIKDKDTDILEKICKETQMDSPRLVEYFLDIIYSLYSDYKEQKNNGVEKRPFNEILSNLFLHSFKPKLSTLEVAENLIERTNELLGIESHIGAGIYNINPDFERRSISYVVGYDFCVDAAKTYAYVHVEIDVEINQDYIEVSHVVYEPTFENSNISDKRVNITNTLLQEYIRARHCEKFSPFANIAVELSLIGENPYGSDLEAHQYIRTKLIIKADNAAHIPSIGKLTFSYDLLLTIANLTLYESFMQIRFFHMPTIWYTPSYKCCGILSGILIKYVFVLTMS
jgi:hypothetical protein